MHRHQRHWPLAAIITTLMFLLACAASATVAQSAGEPKAITVTSNTITATVKGVDIANRRVALTWDDGSIHWYKCPANTVANLNQFNPGDRVSATVVESTAITVQKSDEPLTPGEQGMVTLAPGGDENPVAGTVVAATSQITAKIRDVDKWRRTITVMGEDELASFYVGAGVDFKKFKRGHEVVIRKTEALSLMIEAAAPTNAASAGPLSIEDAMAIGVDAYIYGYPLVSMEMTRRVMTNVGQAGAVHAPMFQFARMQSLPAPGIPDVVASNPDALYCSAWLEVGNEPWVVHVPNTGGRISAFPVIDAWGTVSVTGTAPVGMWENFVISGPNWKGDVPIELTHVHSPTSMVLVAGMVCPNGESDVGAAKTVLDACKTYPLSWYKRSADYAPPGGAVDVSIDMHTPVRDQVAALSISEYFNMLGTLMAANPPADDALARMARIGVVPGKPFALSNLDLSVAAGLEDVPEQAITRIAGYFNKAAPGENGWHFLPNTGLYRRDYLARAAATYMGVGMNRAETVLCVVSQVDAAGAAYDGTDKRVLHFDKGQMPPGDRLWSIALYDERWMLVDNPLHKHAVSGRDSFRANQDGSLDVLIQSEDPGAEWHSNWLPAPRGRFMLIMRLYEPLQTFFDGAWTIPPVTETP